jgi:hypothetical protein
MKFSGDRLEYEFAKSERYSSHERLREELYSQAKQIGVYSPEEYFVSDPERQVSIAKKRSLRSKAGFWDDPRLAMTLTEVDGVLRWNDGYGYRPGTGLRRSRKRLGVDGDVVAPINFEKLEPSEIGGYLQTLDKKLTPDCNVDLPERGVRELVKGAWQNPGARPVAKGRILLFIHGTFSKNEMFLEELSQTAPGKQLLARVQDKKNYQQVLAFDHPTLSVSPVLNAMDLGRVFEGSEADVDVICHSRGGLVTRWWLENYDLRTGGTSRAVMVGSPLAGTSLASAPRLRSGINLLTNVAKVLEKGSALASTAFPFFTIITGLLRLLASVGTVAAKTPVLDAAVALIPGLSAQALVSNNEELNRLNRTRTLTPKYFAVRSDFRPSDPGWAFWKYFVNVGDRVQGLAADLVFDGANDLVVDTASMTVLAQTPEPLSIHQLHDFGTNPTVHHTVYFEQPETATFIASCLGIP